MTNYTRFMSENMTNYTRSPVFIMTNYTRSPVFIMTNYTRFFGVEKCLRKAVFSWGLVGNW